MSPLYTTVTMEGEPPSPKVVERIVMSEAKQAMRESMAVVQAEAQRRVPVRTGHLRRSLNFTVRRIAATVITGTVGTDVFYGPFLDRGTGLYGPLHHWIVPKNGGVLAWPGGFTRGGFGAAGRIGTTAGPGFTLAGRVRKGRAGGKASWAFATKVRGIRPMRFMEDAREVTRGRVLKIYEAHADAAARRIEGEVLLSKFRTAVRGH